MEDRIEALRKCQDRIIKGEIGNKIDREVSRMLLGVMSNSPVLSS